ncbi:hypothetical protein ACQF36_22400 [Streptomyces sp. Marseille-Q5077]|uniref:hypothetical protein n=1 Tax=Streptomyces sp. Marseille-Q5077 TaxID=3418995 RepID=UPI003D033FAF
MAKPLLLGRKEIGRIYNVAAAGISNNWVPQGVLSYEDAVIVSGKPYWPGGLVIGLALPPGSRGRQLDEQALAEVEKEQGATARPRTKEELPPLVGLQEYGALFGVDQERVAHARRRGHGMLPTEDYLLSGSPVWLLESALEAAPATLEQSRMGVWQLQQDVVDALREGRYEGPGSTIAKRGKASAPKA